jgi:hypothetical protein
MAKRHRDRMPGGLADKSKPSEFDPDQLRMGIDVEMEHTKDRSIAREIAMDHLKEDPRYYTKLKKIHKEDLDMNLSETIGWLFDLRESLEEAMKSVQATGQTRGNLPGITPASKKPPPSSRVSRKQAGLPPLVQKKKPMPTRGATDRPPVEMKKKGPDATAQALAGIKKMNRSETDKDLDHIRTMDKSGQSESVRIAMIRRLIEASNREGGGTRLNPREMAAKGMGKVNALRRVGPTSSKGGRKPTKTKRPMPTRNSY